MQQDSTPLHKQVLHENQLLHDSLWLSGFPFIYLNGLTNILTCQRDTQDTRSKGESTLEKTGQFKIRFD